MAIISSIFGVMAVSAINSQYYLHGLVDEQSATATRLMDCGFACTNRDDCAAFTWEPNQVSRF